MITFTKRHIGLLLALSMFCVCTLFVGWSTAQALISSVEGAVSLTLDPPQPSPGDTVTATLESSSINWATTRVTFTLNGEVVQEEEGNATYTFTAGKVGTQIELTGTAHTSSGTRGSDTVRLTVGHVAIVWEGLTYTPPLYSGRALRSQGATTRLLALPSVSDRAGGVVDPAELVFAWRVDGESRPSRIGRGLQSIDVTSKNPLTSLRVGVEIQNDSGDVLARNWVTIPVTHPELLFYEEIPGLNIAHNNALGDTGYVIGNESRLYAEPYYMSVKQRTDPNLEYEWTLDGTSYETPASIVLRPEGVGVGTANISLTTTNRAIWSQRARNDVRMRFNASGEQSSTVSPETTPL